MTEPLYYNASEAARIIGCDSRTIIDMVKHGEIKGACKIGRRYMVPRWWVNRGREDKDA